MKNDVVKKYNRRGSKDSTSLSSLSVPLYRGFTPTPEPRLEKFGASRRRDLVWGFTLLEMIVSIGIFSVVVVAAISISLALKNAQEKASAVQNAQDSVRFSLEFMTKELRQGKDYVLSDCTAGKCHKVNFIRLFAGGVSKSIWYCLDSTKGTILRYEGPTTAPPGDCVDKGLELTGSNVTVSTLLFYAVGEAPGPGDGQPVIVVVVGGTSKNPRAQLQASIVLETAVTQRTRDL